MYGVRKSGKMHGVVMTKQEVVSAMLDLVNYTPDRDLSTIKIVEPAAGHGAFAIEILKRLYTSSRSFNFDFDKALTNIIFFEIDHETANFLTKKIADFLTNKSASDARRLVHVGDYLLSEKIKTDIVIGNPPYVRYDNIPDDIRSIYKKKFKTFSHRADIYIPFFEKSLFELNPNGKLCYICSNRWLKNLYGQKLRSLIGQIYNLEKIINIETLSPFEEEVIAYPSIFVVSNNQSENGETCYYEIDALEQFDATNPTANPPLIKIKTAKAKGDWFTHNTFTKNTSNSHLSKIEEQDFKIGIGVATGCDEIFIRKDFNHIVEQELLLPILKSSDLRSNTFCWNGNYILNPYSPNGNLIDLNKFPLAKSYLEANSERLKKRHTAKNTPSKWYKTIDKITPEITFKPKIVLPDISGNTHIFIDEGKYYPHHNLYYIIGSDIDSLKILAAILMSNHVREQLSAVGNKMNGGYPRWQSQNLKKIFIPNIKSMNCDLKNTLIKAYHEGNIDKINESIPQVYSNDGLPEYKIKDEQLSLFEKKQKYITSQNRTKSN